MKNVREFESKNKEIRMNKKLYCVICSKEFPVDVSVTELWTHISKHFNKENKQVETC